MGLNIVKTVVNEIGGDIKCVSAMGNGADFTITLPRFFPGKELVVREHGPSEPVLFPPVTWDSLREEKYIQGRATIFLVEDNSEMLVYLQNKLYNNFNVFYAFNGKEALDKIKQKPKPDIIISDVMMDIMNGFEFYDKLMENKEYQTVPFIFLTALTSTSDKIQSLQKGAIDYIYKPFNFDELLAKIYAIIKIYDALKQENLLLIGDRLLHYLKSYDPATGMDFTNSRLLEKEKITQTLYEQYGISERQIQIIALLKIGLYRKEICTRLEISMNTLKTHMARLFGKCRVDNKTGLLNIFYG